MTSSNIKIFKAFLTKNNALEELKNEFAKQNKGSKRNAPSFETKLGIVHRESALGGIIEWRDSVKGFKFWNDLDSKWFDHIR